MGAKVLTTASTLMCPHGGTVRAIPSDARVSASAPVLTATDTFLIAGCTFAPGGAASPCVSVQWVVCDLQVKRAGAATLSTASTGLCVNAASAPQGSVQIVSSTARVETR